MKRTVQRRNGFTIVELLVVVVILATLISMLLPSLKSARTAAQRIVCSSNIAQTGRAELLYMNDHRYAIPAIGAYSAALAGQIFNNTAWQDIYVHYLGQPVTYANNDVASSMRFMPLKNNPMQCPSNPRKDSWRGAYVMATGSANDFLIDETRLTKIFNHFSMNRYGPEPALLCERMVVSDYPAGGVYRTETNHWALGTGNPDGGNTFHLDGSVAWYGYQSNSGHYKDYVANGAIFNLQGWASTSIWICTDGTSNLDLRSGGPNCQLGPSWSYTSAFP